MITRQSLVSEVSIKRVVGGRRSWRWSVTFLRPVEGGHAGVFDRREHMGGDYGYTRTAWGAAIAAGRTIRYRTEGDPAALSSP